MRLALEEPQESPASLPNSLQGIVAHRRHGKPATALQVCRWHTHHTLTACHRWRRQVAPADIMQAASTKPHWDWGTTAPQATQRKRTKKKSKPMHNTHYPLGNPPQRGSVCVMHTYMRNEQRKEPKERRGLSPPLVLQIGGLSPAGIGRQISPCKSPTRKQQQKAGYAFFL